MSQKARNTDYFVIKIILLKKVIFRQAFIVLKQFLVR